MQLDGIGMAIGIEQGSPVHPKPNKRCCFQETRLQELSWWLHHYTGLR